MKQSSERLLEQIHKDISDLMMALSNARKEINQHKIVLEHALTDIKAAHVRISSIENNLYKPQASQAANIHVRFPILDFFRNYWHVFAIAGSLVSFLLSYFFGLKIKGNE